MAQLELISPCGPFVCVSGPEGSESGFLCDIYSHRSVFRIYLHIYAAFMLHYIGSVAALI